MQQQTRKLAMLLAAQVAIFLMLPSFDAMFGHMPDGWSPSTRSLFGSEVSGFVILGLTLANLALLLRTRLKWIGGDYAKWRRLHTLTGFLLLSALIVHTGGMHTGMKTSNLLMEAFVAVVALGAIASWWKGMNEQRMAKIGVTASRAHALLIWPMTTLLGVHVISVYYF